MTPEIKPSCANCKFFSTNDREGGRNECRHRSPGSAGWPAVESGDLCGEWHSGAATMKMTCEACSKDFLAIKVGGVPDDRAPFRRIVCGLCNSEGKDTTSFIADHPATDYRPLQKKAEEEGRYDPGMAIVPVPVSAFRFKEPANDNL